MAMLLKLLENKDGWEVVTKIVHVKYQHIAHDLMSLQLVLFCSYQRCNDNCTIETIRSTVLDFLICLNRLLN